MIQVFMIQLSLVTGCKMKDELLDWVVILICCWCIVCGIVGFYMFAFEGDSTSAALNGYIKKFDDCEKYNVLMNGKKCEFIAVAKGVDNE